MSGTAFRARLWAFVLVTLIFLPVAGRATDSLPQRSILVGSELDYPPYALVTKDGKPDGFSVDLMKAVCETMGIGLTFRIGPWSEIRAALEKGEIDALPLVSYSKERAEVFDLTIPHTVAHGAIFKRRGSPDITSVVDLRDKAIIAMRADAGHDWLVRNDISNALILTPTVAESLKLLASGKGDYVLAPRLVGLLTLRQWNLDAIETTGPLIDAYGRGYGFAVKKGDAALLLQLNEGLRVVKETGRYDAIYEKWFGIVDSRGVPQAVILRYAQWGVLALFLLAGLALAWIAILRHTVRARTHELSEARDGLERLVAERTQELRDKNFILDAVIDGGMDAIFVKDRQGRFVLVNRMMASFFGLDPAELLGTRDSDIFPSEIAAETMARDRRVIETGEVSDVEEEVEFQGERRVVHTYKTPYRDDDGNVIGVIGIARDITERRRAEQALKENEIRMRLLLSGVSVGIGVEDLEGRTISVNEGLARMLGYAPGEIKAMRFTEYTHPDYAGRDADLFREMVAGRRDGYQIEKRYITKDGREAWGRLTRTVVRDEAGVPQYCLGMVEDITERKLAEVALRDSEERFAKAFRASPAPMSISLIDSGLTLDVNDEWVALLGFSRDEAIGKTSSEMGCWSGETERSVFVERLRSEGTLRDFEASVITKGGETRRVVLSGEIIDGRRMLLVLHDITDRLEMERRLAHAQKMEAVGQLTGGIAHDFNNLLQVVQTNIEMARQHVAKDERACDHLERALAAGQRGAKLTAQLLSFSRKQLLQPETIGVNPLVEGLIRLLSRTLGEDIEIESRLDGDLPAVVVDPHGLENALLNIALNARSAMPKGGRLTVATRSVRLDNARIIEDGLLPVGDYVEIAVADTGCGMSADVLERAFEPFFTTKNVGEGSGLGLSMVYGFARQSGGSVSLESEPGAGTTVRILLPAVATEAERRAAKRETPEIERGAGTILVVEDDPDVRGSAVLVLRSCGYEVREAEDGESALEILGENPDVDLLFTDVVMPNGMNGFDLAREATRRHPDLKVVLTSGYPESALEKSGVSKTHFRVLGKPYAKRDLARLLAGMLSGD